MFSLGDVADLFFVDMTIKEAIGQPWDKRFDLACTHHVGLCVARAEYRAS